MLYVTSPGFTNLINGSLYFLITFTPCLWQPPVCSLFLWVLFFLDSTYKWDHMVFVFLWLTSLSIVPWKISFFFFYGWIIFRCIYTPHFLYLFICWWTLSLIHVLAIVNNAAANMEVKCIFEVVILFLSDVYLEVELLNHVVLLFLIFWGTSILFSIVAAPIYIPTNSAQEFTFLHILDNIYLLSFWW